MKLNLPTKLTVLRLLLIPFCMAAIIAPVFPGDVIWRIVAVAIFALTSITDMLDGMIARKYNLVTTLGRFLDPLADKMLIIGVLISVMLRYSEDKTFCTVLGIALFVIVLREMSVTLLRMMAASKDGIVIAAAWLGKCKTVTQMAAVIVMLVEPVSFISQYTHLALSYILIAAMTFMTVWSGISYFKAYLPVLKEA